MRVSRTVSHSVTGKMIAVGLPWDNHLFVQEYWLHGKPHYAIANTSGADVELFMTDWNGKPGKDLAGPWSINRNSVRHFEIQHLLNDSLGSLIAISSPRETILGLLRTPLVPPSYFMEQASGEILTIGGLNSGDSNANLGCWQNQLVFESAQITSLTFQFPAHLTLNFPRQSASFSQLPVVSVLSASSDTLIIQDNPDAIVMNAPKNLLSSWQQVTLKVRLPDVRGTVMAALTGRAVTDNGAGFAFGRGLVTR